MSLSNSALEIVLYCGAPCSVLPVCTSAMSESDCSEPFKYMILLPVEMANGRVGAGAAPASPLAASMITT